MNIEDYSDLPDLLNILPSLPGLPEYNTLILERNYFEINVYDLLISDVVGVIPDDFWEPIVVKLSTVKIKKLKTINCESECIICAENREKFKEMNCCKQSMCCGCVNIWFNTSVKCPFCIQDLRDFL